jgi:hypothetical protein
VRRIGRSAAFASVRLQLDFIEVAVFMLGIADRALSGIAVAENRAEDRFTVVIQFLDAPISGVLAISEFPGAKSSGVGPPLIVNFPVRDPDIRTAAGA